MPTDTFFRLPEEKRQRLTRAVCRELSRVPFSEYSINRVVQDANIPRGSYYQYFESRDDVFSYVASSFRDDMAKALSKLLEKHGGDIFLAIPELYDSAVEYLLAQENMQFVRNIVSESRQRGFLPPPVHGASGCFPLPAELDAKLLAAESEDECREILLIVSGVFGGAMMATLEGLPASAVRARLTRSLEWLQFGMRRKDA